MNDELFNEVIASRKLNKYKITIDSTYCKINVIWCRTVYAYNEEILTDEHSHSFYEIHYALTGACNLKINGTEKVIDKGEF